MYPLDIVMNIMKSIKEKYKDRLYYNVWFNSVSISKIENGEAHEKTFSFNEVLKWNNNPPFYFDRAWVEKE